MKKCSKCGEAKPPSEFHKCAKSSDGLANKCKPCKAEYKRAEYIKSRETCLARTAKYRAANPERVSLAKKAARLKKIDHYKAKEKAAYWNNREAALAYFAQYRQSHKAEKASRDRSYVRQRMAADPLFRMTYTVRNRIFYAVRDRGFKKGAKTAEMLGCDWIVLREHLEAKFCDGMTWDNYGDWHIDHIVPLASATSEEELIRLCHYKNLQPLWAADNIRKGAKIAA